MKYAAGKILQGKRWKSFLSGRGKRWIEPFCGGLGAFQSVYGSYDAYLLNDLSPIADMWRAAKGGWIPECRDVSKEQWLQSKKRAFDESGSPDDIFVTHACSFSGRAKGGWTTDETGGGRGVKSGFSRLIKVGKMLNDPKCVVTRGDYSTSLSAAGNEDVVYLDPPYGKSDGFWILSKQDHEIFDLQRMVDLSEGASARGALVFISCYDDLSSTGWAKVHVNRDVINSYAGKRVYTYKDEFMWCKEPI